MREVTVPLRLIDFARDLLTKVSREVLKAIDEFDSVIATPGDAEPVCVPLWSITFGYPQYRVQVRHTEDCDHD